MSLRKPLSSAFIHAEARAERRIAVGHVQSPHGTEEDYVVSQELKAEKKTKAIADRLDALRTFMAKGLEARAARSAEARLPTAQDLPDGVRAGPPPDHADFQLERPPLLGALLPRLGHHEPRPSSAEERAFHQAQTTWEGAKQREDRALADLLAAFREREAERAAAAAELARGEPADLERALGAALADLAQPFEAPPPAALALDGSTGSAAVDLRVPDAAQLVPSVARYRYAKKRDAILPVPLAEDKRQALYRRVLAQLALLAFEAAFDALPAAFLDRMSLRLHAEAIDPATGRMTRTDLLRVTATRAAFAALDLARVDPIPCVQRLAGGDAFPRPGANP